MGRAGRGGGGGFRGGGFGGSRGFGSHSGSTHRSSFSSSRSSSSYRSSSRSSWGGSYHRHYNSGPRFYYFGGTRYSNSSTGGGYSSADPSAVVRSFVKIVFWILLIIILLPSASNDSPGSSGITPSTVNREKFDGEQYYDPTKWYTDELDWIKNPTTLQVGMKKFYEKTGVQPYLYITGMEILSDSKMQQYANDLYDTLFDDEAHLLVVFSEHNDQYKSCYIVGTAAKTVIDDEAGEILLDYIDHYYYSNYDEDEFFARSFREAADRIMRVTPHYSRIFIIFVLVISLTVILFAWWKKKKQHKLDEMKQAQDILNADLNEFGSSSAYNGSFESSEVEELKKKYDN